MLKKSLSLAVVISALLSASAFAQAPAPATQGTPPATPGARGGAQTPPAAPGQPQGPPPPVPGQGRGGQGVGAQGDPDPGVHFIVVIDNPSVRVLQVTLQPGAVRRSHVHNDVTFHMMVPVTGTLEVTLEDKVFNAAPGQAYYMVKGQPHGFTNKTTAPVQVIELFMKPPAEAAGATAAAPAAAPATAPATEPTPTTAAPGTK